VSEYIYVHMHKYNLMDSITYVIYHYNKVIL